jgi:hypothetical protein
LARIAPRSPHGREGSLRHHRGNLREALVNAARKLIAARGPASFTLVEVMLPCGATLLTLERFVRGFQAARERGWSALRFACVEPPPCHHRA